MKKRNPKVQIKKDRLDKYKELLYIYQSKKGYDTLIQNVTLEELINLIATAIVDIDIELQMEIDWIKHLENRIL